MRPVTLSPTVRRIGPALLLFVLLARRRHACVPAARRRPARAPCPPRRRCPAARAGDARADPLSLVAWLFTPIFQVMFIILLAVYQFLENLGAPGAIAWAIVVLTLIVRAVLIPLVPQAAGLPAPDAAHPAGAQGDPEALQGRPDEGPAAQQELFKERGVNPLAGCLPLLLQLPLLFIMYSVIQHGLTNVDPSAMLTVFGVQVVDLQCRTSTRPRHAGRALGPCIDTVVPILGNIGRSPRPSCDRRLRAELPGHRLGAPPARAVADDAAGRRPDQRRPERPDPAPDDAVPAAHLGRLRRVPAGGPVHLLDRGDALLDRAAVPDRRLGRDVPAVRLDARLRRRPHPALPGGDATTTRPKSSVRPS